MSLANQPAFPFVPNEQRLIDGKWDQNFEPGESGMTMRQYYAGLAMQGILANPLLYADAKIVCQNIEEDEHTILNRMAVQAADELISMLANSADHPE